MRRRHFLKATGLTLTLPALESLGGAKDLEDSAGIKRLFLMTDGYGFYTPHFYPSKIGPDYPSNDVIKALDPLRNDLTILGNLQHLNGHANQKFVATGSPKSVHFGDSLDQIAARHLSQTVPIDSLLLSTRQQATGGSFRNKVPVAMMYDTEEVFDFLFTKGDVKARTKRLSHEHSTLAGSAAAHTGRNAPAILAGGRLPHHGRYRHFEQLEPMPKLHFTVLQHLGIPAERSSDSQSTLNI